DAVPTTRKLLGAFHAYTWGDARTAEGAPWTHKGPGTVRKHGPGPLEAAQAALSSPPPKRSR
ncbi:hypothetical protein, partial [Streptomyces syringium]|uniref:hypothetical protein n=1 Tax=Streptomyces syringium TaxID=76729 RepID=UPI00343E7B35